MNGHAREVLRCDYHPPGGKRGCRDRFTARKPVSRRAARVLDRRKPVVPGERPCRLTSRKGRWMKAVTWHGKRDVRVDTVPDPKVEEPTDAVIEVTSTNICGSVL